MWPRSDHTDKLCLHYVMTQTKADRRQLRHAAKVNGNMKHKVAKASQKRDKSEEIVAHPERHLAVIGQQGDIKDKAAQELL